MTALFLLLAAMSGQRDIPGSKIHGINERHGWRTSKYLLGPLEFGAPDRAVVSFEEVLPRYEPTHSCKAGWCDADPDR